jgi:AcrR family transcriptional regulator
MSTTKIVSLSSRRNDLSKRVILDAAVELLETSGVADLTARAIAKHANIAERTMFRYFATRDELLDAIADEVRSRLPLPPPPRTADELRAMPRRLYEGLEANQRLVLAGMHSAIVERMRDSAARTRWPAVAKLVDELAPRRRAQDRKIAAMNIAYYLNATSWRYHRFYFHLSLEDSIACAERAIELALADIGI